MPDRWQSKTVGELCTFSSGHGFGPNDWASDGLPIIRIQNLNGSRQFNYFDGQPDASWIVEPGELLFAWAGVQGVSFGAKEWPGPQAVLNQHIYRIRSRGTVEQAWLRLVLDDVTHRIERRAHGFKSNLVHVRKSDITEQIVPVPPEDERQAILAIDDATTRQFKAADRLVAAKEKMLAGLMQQLLTGRRRLPAFADQPLVEVHVGNIAEETSERCGDRTDITVLSCTKSVGLVDSLEYFGRQVFGDDLSNYKVVRRDEFAYATNHIEEGSIGLLTHRDAGLVSPMYTVFRTREMVVPSFLFRVLKTERYRQKFEAWTSASVNRRGGLRWGEFSQIKVPLPSRDEQYAIADVLDTAQREINLLKQLRDQIQQQKRGLMQKLLTGQIPAKEALYG